MAIFVLRPEVLYNAMGKRKNKAEFYSCIYHCVIQHLAIILNPPLECATLLHKQHKAKCHKQLTYINKTVNYNQVNY